MSTANLVGYDSVANTVAEWRQIVPTETPSVIGSYRNGDFANSTVAKTAFPDARHVDYDVNGSEPAACFLDDEPGDARDSQAPGWAKRWLALGKRAIADPGLYKSASGVSALVSVMLDAGWKRNQFLIQSAHYTGVAHICGPGACAYPQADCTQYADHGLRGQNTDLNLFHPHVFGIGPKPVYDPHYAWFDTTKRALLAGWSELTLVKAYDRLRATQTTTSHPNRVRLALLRVLLRRAAGRIATLPPDSVDRRAWRKRELTDRAQGERFV